MVSLRRVTIYRDLFRDCGTPRAASPTNRPYRRQRKAARRGRRALQMCRLQQTTGGKQSVQRYHIIGEYPVFVQEGDNLTHFGISGAGAFA